MKRIFILTVICFFAVTSLFSGGPSGCGGGNKVTLTVALSGPGDGTITSDVGDINCNQDGGTCSAEINVDTVVILTAAASSVSAFSDWSGGSCTGSSTCTVTLTADTTVTADFARKIVFQSPRALNGSDENNANEVRNIWVVNSDGTGLAALTGLTSNAGLFAEKPQWSPDGAQILFDSNGALDGSDALNDNETGNIWVVDADGTGLTNLTALKAALADSFDARWSPDGSQIVYSSARAFDGSDAANAGTVGNIWIMDADGGNATPLTELTAANSNQPVWSPDGTQIAFRSRGALDGSDTLNGASNIWVMNADGSEKTALTNLTTSGLFTSLEWSPDGTQIIFTSNRALDGNDEANINSVANVWVMNVDGTGLTHLTDLTASNTFTSTPRQSPDGEKIGFYSARALDGSDAAISNSNIWTMNPDGSSLSALTQFSDIALGPSEFDWSPDGTMIAFASGTAFDGSNAANTNDTVNIWIMNADGSEAAPVTDATVKVNGNQSNFPEWAP